MSNDFLKRRQAEYEERNMLSTIVTKLDEQNTLLLKQSEQLNWQRHALETQVAKIDKIEQKIDTFEYIFNAISQSYFSKIVEYVDNASKTFELMDFSSPNDINFAKMKMEVLEDTAKMLSKKAFEPKENETNPTTINFSQVYAEMIDPLMEQIKLINGKLDTLEKEVSFARNGIKGAVNDVSSVYRRIGFTDKKIKEMEKNLSSNDYSLQEQIYKVKGEIIEAVTGMKESARRSAGAIRDEIKASGRSARINRYGSMNTR
jgi:hypothetical protein